MIPLLLFGAFCTLAVWFLLHFMDRPIEAVHFAILAYFILITGALHIWQVQGLATDPKGFVRRFMASLVIKLVVSLALLVPILMRSTGDAFFTTGLLFAGLYLAFLVFSAIRLTDALRNGPGT